MNKNEKQLKNNIEWILGGIENDVSDNGDEYRITREQAISTCASEVYDIKYNGNGHCQYGKGIAGELRFLGREKLEEMVNEALEEYDVLVEETEDAQATEDTQEEAQEQEEASAPREFKADAWVANADGEKEYFKGTFRVNEVRVGWHKVVMFLANGATIALPRKTYTADGEVHYTEVELNGGQTRTHGQGFKRWSATVYNWGDESNGFEKQPTGNDDFYLYVEA